jgi:hypothetical protein
MRDVLGLSPDALWNQAAGGGRAVTARRSK